MDKGLNNFLNQSLIGNNMHKSLVQFTLIALAFIFSPIAAMECEVNKKYVSMDTIQSMCSAIYEQAKDDKFKPDLIIGLSRGGLIPLGFLSGEKMFNNRNTRAISLKSYSDNGEQSAVKLLLPIHTEDLKEFKSILVVDDLADTGKSLEFVIKSLERDLLANIKVATLFYKKKSIIKPDYYVEETSDWIVFPWEE